jgi:hypothetical protein
LMIFDKQWLERVHLSCSFVLGGKQVEQTRVGEQLYMAHSKSNRSM